MAPPGGGAPRRPKRDSSGLATQRSGPWRAPHVFPREPPLPEHPKGGFPRGAGAVGLENPGRGSFPLGCPLPASPSPGQSGPHSPSDAETPTAQERRRCCGVRRQRRPEGRAGGGGRDCEGDAPRRSPGAPPLGGPRFSLSSPAPGSTPAPARERERDALTSRTPHEGAPAAGEGLRSPFPQRLDSGSLNGVAGVSGERPLS